MNEKPLITIAIDFDGTIVEWNYPYIGKENDNCIETLLRWQRVYKVGYILDTMRSGSELTEAINWCKSKGLEFYGIQTNPTQKEWTDSPKAHATFSIDDRSASAKLKVGSNGKRCLDWGVLIEEFEPLLSNLFDSRSESLCEKTYPKILRNQFVTINIVTRDDITVRFQTFMHNRDSVNLVVSRNDRTYEVNGISKDMTIFELYQMLEKTYKPKSIDWEISSIDDVKILCEAASKREVLAEIVTQQYGAAITRLLVE